MAKRKFRFSLTVAKEISPSVPVLLGGDFSESVAKAGAFHYDAVELHYIDLGDLDVEKAAEACRKNRIGVSAVATGAIYVNHHLSLTDDDKSKREAALAKLKEHVDVCESLSAAVILGCVRGNIPDRANHDLYVEYLKRLKESLKMLSDYAGPKKVPVVLEAINRYENNYLNTAAETAAFLSDCNLPNVKILLDTFHMNIEDPDIYESFRESRDLLGYVHFADSNRQYPGKGHIDFKKIMDILSEIDYAGYVGFEYLPLPDGELAAKKGIEYLKTI